RGTGNLLLRRASAEARAELAERPVRAAEHRLLTAPLPVRQRLLGLPRLHLCARQDPAQPITQRSRRNHRLHGLDQLVEPTVERWEVGAGRARWGCAELEGADIAGGDSIAVAIGRTGEATLVREGRRTVVPAGVDRRAAGQKRLGRGGATVVLQRTEPRVHVDEVPGARKPAGVAAVQVVPLGSQGAAAGTAVSRGTVRDDHVAERSRAEVVEAATVAGGGAVV